ncbi:MAG: 30S ribosomal protein S9 [Deltaproteobacteria bacterium]|nr:30S ribosomal protein S9 [Deltaproteobacteria bacterium]
MPDTNDAVRATGRRKEASASVWLRPGQGKVTINGRDIEDYFPREVHRISVRQPLVAVEKVGDFDIKASVKGGGETGQAGAIRHGIARALVEFDPDMRPVVKKAGFLTRDARCKERKKYGQPGARKRFQYSKR